MRAKQFTKRKNRTKITKKNRSTKKNNKRNKIIVRRTRKGGMWRLTSNKKMPRAEMTSVSGDIVAQPYNGYDTYPNADVEYTQYGKYDNATREEELNDLYEDINKNGFPIHTEEKRALLKRYPEFDVNIKPKGLYGNKNTMLYQAIYQSNPGLSHDIINHPTISEQTLEEELQYINSIPKLNKSQYKIKQMIEEKLQSMRDNKPSAPPLQEDFEPSAPPLQEDFEPSAPPIMTSYQIHNLDTGEIGDIRHLPNVPSQEPINLPNVPTHQPVLLPNAPKKSSSNIIARMIGRK